MTAVPQSSRMPQSSYFSGKRRNPNSACCHAASGSPGSFGKDPSLLNGPCILTCKMPGLGSGSTNGGGTYSNRLLNIVSGTTRRYSATSSSAPWKELLVFPPIVDPNQTSSSSTTGGAVVAPPMSHWPSTSFPSMYARIDSGFPKV